MQLAVRIWTDNGMLYPVKFSVIYDLKEKVSSIRAFVKNDKFITTDYMMITPFMAINGPIFEKDIVIVDGNEDVLRIVEFNLDEGVYLAVNADDKNDTIIMTQKLSYETAGNIYEDGDLIGMEQPNNKIEKTDDVKKEKQEEPKKPVEEKAVVEAKPVVVEPVVMEPVVSVEPSTNVSEENKDAQPAVQAEGTQNKKKKKKKKRHPNENSDNNSQQANTVNENVETNNDSANETKEVVTEVAPVVENNEKEATNEKQPVDDKNDSVVNIHENKENIVKNTVLAQELPVDDKKEEIVSGPIVEESEDITGDSYVEDTQPPVPEEKVEDAPKEEKSASKNPGPKKASAELHFVSDCSNDHGAYVFMILSRGIKETYMGEEDNTNPKKIALQGLIDALATFEGEFNVKVFTNSQYAVYPFLKGWINKWSNSNWFKNENEKIQNFELWAQLLELSNRLNVKWEFVQSPTNNMSKCMDVLKKNM